MGNIDRNKIKKKEFTIGSLEEQIEKYCIELASTYTDNILKLYNKLPESRGGRYINSDLMKMTFPFYANSVENRRLYNTAITNSAAVLTNEAYIRALQNKDVKRCVYITGPYGAGKSYFTQALFECNQDGLLESSIVYEGSITPPAFGEKIKYAIEQGVTPHIIALNPTLELSIRNVKERASRIGRDVEKGEILDKFCYFYTYMKCIIEEFEGISFNICNKKSNKSVDIDYSSNISDLYHGTVQEIEQEYDRIIRELNLPMPPVLPLIFPSSEERWVYIQYSARRLTFL